MFLLLCISIGLVFMLSGGVSADNGVGHNNQWRPVDADSIYDARYIRPGTERRVKSPKASSGSKASNKKSAKVTKAPNASSNKASKSSKSDDAPIAISPVAPISPISPIAPIRPVETAPPTGSPPVVSPEAPVASPVALGATASITIDVDETRRRQMKDETRTVLNEDDSPTAHGMTDRRVEAVGELFVEVSCSDGNGKQVVQKAEITIRQQTTVYAVHFEDLPIYEVCTVSVTDSDGGLATDGFVAGVVNELFVSPQPFQEPAKDKNFQFVDGSAEGWMLIGPRDSFAVIPHLEVASLSNVFDRNDEDMDEFRLLLESQSQPNDASVSNKTFFNDTDVMEEFDNYDLVVSTNQASPGVVSASLTFDITIPGSTIEIRYRIIAEKMMFEIVDGQNNDYILWNLRTASSHLSLTNSIVGLGKEAFDQTGSTDWQTVRLPNASGIAEVRATVGKVGKSKYPSHLVIDFVELSSR